MKLSGNKILITGGASGLGLGLTEGFLRENNTVIICGRREDLLKQITDKHPQVIGRVCDLTNEADRIELYDWISNYHKDLNVLVNNAGIQNSMSISDHDFYSKSVNEIETNITAPIHLTTQVLNLPSLKTIINVTSGLAFVQISKVPIYCASKAFMHSFTLSLRHLVKEKGIEIIEIIPPALNTDLGGKGLHDSHPPVSKFIDAVFKQLRDGKNEVAWGFSEQMLKATPEVIAETFKAMNS